MVDISRKEIYVLYNKMPNIETAERIIEFLKYRTEPVTPTTIHKETNMSYKAIIGSLDFLKDNRIIEIWSDGRLQLIRYKDKGESHEFNE